MPSTRSSPSEWEEWSSNFKACFSVFETSAIGVLDRVEGRAEPVQDEDLALITLETGDPDVEASRKAVTFSRKPHHLLTNLTTDTARQTQPFRLYRNFALPDATRCVSLLTQLLDFKLTQQLLRLTSTTGKPSRSSMSDYLEPNFPIAC